MDTNAMKPEMLPIGIVMFFVAVVVVVLNDKLKKKSDSPDAPPPKNALNVKTVLIGVPLVAIALSYGRELFLYGREFLHENPDLKWLVPCVFVAFVLGLSHRLVWILFKAYVLGGPKPLALRILRTKENGEIELSCPECKTPGPFSQSAPNGIHFKCEKCGMEMKKS